MGVILEIFYLSMASVRMSVGRIWRINGRPYISSVNGGHLFTVGMISEVVEVRDDSRPILPRLYKK